MSKQPTQLLAEYVSNLQWQALPPEVVESAKLRVLDYLASAMAGYRLNRTFSDTVTGMYRDMGGVKESRVLFSDLQLPAPNAAFLNAAYGHGADIDDGHRTANGHPGIVVIPAALALAEAHHMSGKDVILAVVAGYDVFVRLASAVNPAHFARGFHSTGTVGTIAAAAAAAKVLRLDFEGVRNSISLGAVQAAGVHEISESAQASKPLSPAKAAYGGVLSGRMARLGIEGPLEALEGTKGFLKAFTDKFDFEILAEGTRAEVRHYPVLCEVVSGLSPLPRWDRRRDSFVRIRRCAAGSDRQDQGLHLPQRHKDRRRNSSNPIRRLNLAPSAESGSKIPPTIFMALG